jgi:dissimilatory sulfite reductase (desulfoviridin) alpha/beta subunit
VVLSPGNMVCEAGVADTEKSAKSCTKLATEGTPAEFKMKSR